MFFFLFSEKPAFLHKDAQNYALMLSKSMPNLIICKLTLSYFCWMLKFYACNIQRSVVVLMMVSSCMSQYVLLVLYWLAYYASTAMHSERALIVL